MYVAEAVTPQTCARPMRVPAQTSARCTLASHPIHHSRTNIAHRHRTSYPRSWLWLGGLSPLTAPSTASTWRLCFGSRHQACTQSCFSRWEERCTTRSYLDSTRATRCQGRSLRPFARRGGRRCTRSWSGWWWCVVMDVCSGKIDGDGDRRISWRCERSWSGWCGEVMGGLVVIVMVMVIRIVLWQLLITCMCLIHSLFIHAFHFHHTRPCVLCLRWDTHPSAADHPLPATPTPPSTTPATRAHSVFRLDGCMYLCCSI